MNICLQINNVSLLIENKKIIKDLNLQVKQAEIHAIMGPNGSGKSSLAFAIMGHPKVTISAGSVMFMGKHINHLSPDKRAQLGLFLAFQHPVEIPGATVFSVLKEAYSAITGKLISVTRFSDILYKKMDLLHIDHAFVYRNFNEGFSGGEKKKFEILQMLLLRPKCAILDEIDSGLDIDSIEIVANGILQLRKENPTMSLLFITHHHHILRYMVPDFVHIMRQGSIIASGDNVLAKRIIHQGYKAFT